MVELNNENAYSILEVGETYKFAGYYWTVCELINDGRTAVLQSHGVTTGPWPGFKMLKFGGNVDNFYAEDIDGDDISAYDDKMQALYDGIKDVEDKSASYGKGLYLISKEKAGFTEWAASGSGNYWQVLKAAAENFSPSRAVYCAWLSTAFGGNHAWYIYSDGGVYGSDNQNGDFVVAPAFNLDLSKVEVVDDEIIKKAQAASSPVEQDGNCQEHQLLGKTYKFAGYYWTVCELINNGRVAVIQSHGVTHGAWPGFVMPQFGNGSYYADSIDGQDISSYDDKMQSLYDNIKEVEDTSVSYGKGLYLISKEKTGFTEIFDPGSGYYWTELKAVAENTSAFGNASYSAWLGSAFGSYYAWFVSSDGSIYGYAQNVDFVVAPAFNLDLSKVEIAGDEIIKKSKFDFASMALTTPSDNNLSANSNHTSMSAASDNTPKKMDL